MPHRRVISYTFGAAPLVPDRSARAIFKAYRDMIQPATGPTMLLRKAATRTSLVSGKITNISDDPARVGLSPSCSLRDGNLGLRVPLRCQQAPLFLLGVHLDAVEREPVQLQAKDLYCDLRDDVAGQ